MKIVVLDGYTLNPGDLNWDGLEALGECAVYDRTSVTEIPVRAAAAAIVLTNKTPLSRETLPSFLHSGTSASSPPDTTSWMSLRRVSAASP